MSFNVFKVLLFHAFNTFNQFNVIFAIIKNFFCAITFAFQVLDNYNYFLQYLLFSWVCVILIICTFSFIYNI